MCKSHRELAVSSGTWELRPLILALDQPATISTARLLTGGTIRFISYCLQCGLAVAFTPGNRNGEARLDIAPNS